MYINFGRRVQESEKNWMMDVQIHVIIAVQQIRLFFWNMLLVTFVCQIQLTSFHVACCKKQQHHHINSPKGCRQRSTDYGHSLSPVARNSKLMRHSFSIRYKCGLKDRIDFDQSCRKLIDNDLYCYATVKHNKIHVSWTTNQTAGQLFCRWINQFNVVPDEKWSHSP
jgi:hypothetical protein